MTTISEALTIAVGHHQAGRLQQAEEIYHQVLGADPGQADALHFLGVIAHQNGRNQEAIDRISLAIEANPHNAGFHSNIGEAYRAMGEFDEAVASYEQALRLRPDSAQTHNNLGAALQGQGKFDEAVASCRRALEIRPDYAEAHANLGAALKELGRLDEAARNCREAVKIKPDFAEAHNNLGNVARRQGDLAEAVASYRKAVEIAPNYADAHRNLALAWLERKDFCEAEASFDRVLQIRPECVEAYDNLAAVLKMQGKFDEALECCRRAVEIRPDSGLAHHVLGTVLEVQGKLDQAVSSYQRALEIMPNSFEARVNLGNTFQRQGNLETAIECFDRALKIKPGVASVYCNIGNAFQAQGDAQKAVSAYKESLQIEFSDSARCSLAMVLPVVYRSLDEMQYWRDRLVGEVDALLREGMKLDPGKNTIPSVFFLAYQGLDDRDIHEKISQLFDAAPRCDVRRRRESGSRRGTIRVGFISRFFRNHAIGRLMRGLLAQLSNDSLQVVVLSVGDHQDEVAREIGSRADRYVVVPNILEFARETVAAQELDVLVYADIGMDPITSALARTRLAPVQCVMWGHPVTTGIATIDYYISSELLEPDNAAEHYSEQLIQLKTLPAYYNRPVVPSSPRTRGDYGLTDDRHIYLCAQSVFKFHPEFDAPLGEVLRRDRAGQVVIIEGRFSYWTQSLRDRFRATIPDCADRIKFLPAVRHGDFLNLLALSDVILDPFHFGGGNTTYETMSVGTPVVTLPAAYMRGRAAYAAYKKMGISDCVATCPQHYVDIAVRLGTDREYRDAMRSKILSASHVLFDDAEAVDELRRFFLGAVGQ